MRLDRVTRQEEALADLREREVGSQEGEHPQLGRRECGHSRRRHAHALQLRLHLVHALHEDAEIGTMAKDPLDLSEHGASAGRIGEREVGVSELEPYQHREPRDGVCQLRSQPLCANEIVARCRQLSAM